MAELMAEYSPPIPAPVRKRKQQKLQKFHETADRMTPQRYMVRVTKKSLRRPNRSVAQPKMIEPITAPRMYHEASSPIWAGVKASVRGLPRIPLMAPTRVTSRPSRIQVIPRDKITNWR